MVESKKSRPNSSDKGRKKKVLGKGIDALIREAGTGAEDAGGYLACDVDLILPNRYQPRVDFSETELAELAESIREQGVIQPLIVRKDGSGYELVAGERRLRAAKQVGLERVPVVVREFTDAAMLEISIVENVQRENLNPIEEAEAYHRLIQEFDLTQEDVALRVGKSRSAVANFLRLLQLPEGIRDSLRAGDLSNGHARALLSLESAPMQEKVRQMILNRHLSVRQTEALVKSLKAPIKKSEPAAETEADRHLNAVMNGLSEKFGTRVSLQKKGDGGRVVIDFYSSADLDRLLRLLG
ncbi:MAG: chromosome partitioning protein ParB [Deltaproteobacteria bacterium]|nr:MAG: chromosome partitioning protein ParB [Deltaproteobacteria bacterium]